MVHRAAHDKTRLGYDGAGPAAGIGRQGKGRNFMMEIASVLAGGWLRHAGARIGLAAAVAIAMGMAPVAAQQKQEKLSLIHI